MHSGQQVTLEADNTTVIISGLTTAGFLKAVDASGHNKFELHPNNNSLDFFKGLIKKKLNAPNE